MIFSMHLFSSSYIVTFPGVIDYAIHLPTLVAFHGVSIHFENLSDYTLLGPLFADLV